MSLNMVSSSTTIILSDPNGVDYVTSRRVRNYVFDDGTDVQVDVGKQNEGIILHGTETSDAVNKMYWVNQVMDNQEEVTLSGMTDTHLDADYLISNVDYSQKMGWIERYDWSISFERVDED